MLVEANIDGKVGIFVFDTGADDIILNSKSNLTSADAEFATLSGVMQVSQTQIKTLSIGEFNISMLEAYSSDLTSVETHLEQPILGILGANFLSTEIIHINLEQQWIEAYPDHSVKGLDSSDFSESTLEIENDIILVPMTIGGVVYQFLLDTGASISMIDKSILKKSKALIKTSNENISLSTAASASSIDIHYLKNFRLANYSISNLRFGTIDFNTYDLGIEVDGILALSDLPFSEVVLDYGSEKIYWKLPSDFVANK